MIESSLASELRNLFAKAKMPSSPAIAARVLELQPGFTISETCAVFDIHPSIAEPLSEALCLAGLPK